MSYTLTEISHRIRDTNVLQRKMIEISRYSGSRVMLMGFDEARLGIISVVRGCLREGRLD